MSRGEKNMKKKVKIKTLNEETVEADMHYVTKHMKKTVIRLGRNSAM